MNILDSPDLVELVIQHLIRDKEVFNKAKDLKITPDDFVVGDSFGNQIYKEFVASAFEINDTPISVDLFQIHIRDKIRSNKLDISQTDSISSLISFVFDKELNSAYILSHLTDFIKNKRTHKLKVQHKDDFDTLTKEYSKLIVDLRSSEHADDAETYSPFETLTFRDSVDIIPTGIAKIDSEIMGLGKQEYGLLLGNSGGGKTLLGSLLIKNAAFNGRKGLYVTLEEPGKTINNRFYSSAFHLSYTNLHRGLADENLKQSFASMTDEMKMRFTNIRVADLRKLRPLTPSSLAIWLDHWCETNNFYPEVIEIDQLEFMEPDSKKKGATEAQEYEQLSAELEEFSNRSIYGNYFAFWVQHQLKGKLKATFTMDDIANCKAIIRKADTAMCIGRENTQTDVIHISSIKARHSKNFHQTFKGNFEFMSLLDSDPLDAGSSRSVVFRPKQPAAPVTPVINNAFVRV